MSGPRGGGGSDEWSLGGGGGSDEWNFFCDACGLRSQQ